LFCMQGDLERAEPLLKTSLEHYNPDDYILLYLKQVSFIKAEYAIALGNYSDAIDEMNMLVNQLRRKNVRSLLPEALRIKGEAQLHNEQISEAFQTFLEAKDASEQLNERRQYWMILARLAEFEMQQGNLEQAAKYRQEAKDTITYVADSITDKKLRDKFLSLPEVQQTLSFKT